MALTSGHNEVWPENPTALATPPQRPHYNRRNTTNTKATTPQRPQHHKAHSTTIPTAPLLRPHHHKGHTHYYLVSCDYEGQGGREGYWLVFSADSIVDKVVFMMV
ncbi:hypothetical protein Pmani_029977 [Petrolisthes manimaculis]|uniref:Uncharacterized protein n=1 Tax=Petrolisthes manimaculis TaxID=1843537 RepID=A0AAE1NYB6_9EUCA|nr:hypothetical protein Pmani_029977 [Petrolisthes manimaculis]